jgi:hypothetical protein
LTLSQAVTLSPFLLDADHVLPAGFVHEAVKAGASK